MRRWLKVTLAIVVALAALLVLNAIALTNATKDAERTVDGAQLVETSSGTLQVSQQGQAGGSPVVLIHGYAGSMAWFEELAPLLGTTHRVISVELLGHGGSDKPGAGYEITEQASAVAEALAKLNVSNATIVGHSLGGTVAAALAEQSPELAWRIAIIDQAPDDGYEKSSVSDGVTYAPVIGPAIFRLALIGPGSAVRSQYEIAFAPDFNQASGFENPDQVVDDLREMTYTSYREAAEAEVDYTDARPLDDRLSAIGVPLLVIFGAEDQVYDAEESLAAYSDIPGVQTELLEGAGHSPNVEAPERTAALIDAFIARSEAAERAERRARARKRAAKQEARKRAAQARKQQAAKQAKEEKQSSSDKQGEKQDKPSGQPAPANP